MVFNATFNTISVISWRLQVDEVLMKCNGFMNRIVHMVIRVTIPGIREENGLVTWYLSKSSHIPPREKATFR